MFREVKPKPHIVYLPEVYKEALGLSYEWLKVERTFAPAKYELPKDTATETEKQVFDFAQVGRMAVHRIGSDFERIIDESDKELLSAGAEVIQVWLKLSSPLVGGAVATLRDRNYFLGGLLPRWFNEDGLLMQKIIGRPNWDGIRLYSERARKILDFVRSDWKRMSDNPT
jgi:hypothetical protein